MTTADGNAARHASGSASVPSDPVPKTFLHYTYSDEVNAAANRNRASLEGVSTPSAAKMREIVREAAAKMGVDPRLALAHASVESDFDMRTVSPANAVGVMQVIPSSGEWASRMVGRQPHPLDPQDNAAAGVPRLVKAAMTPSWPIRGRLENYRIPAGGLFPGGDYPQTLS